MILPRFELAEPASVGEACALLQSNGKARVIAGGTDLLVSLKKKAVSAELLVSLAKIRGLSGMAVSEKDHLSIGPMVSIAEIAGSPQVEASFPALSKAAGKLGSLQIRNRATIGGNICTARPAGDTIGPLIAYGATVEITSPKGSRSAPVETIFKGPGQTTVGKDEIITSIVLKQPTGRNGASYLKYTIRNAMEIALVSVTTVISIDNGVCRSARVVLGAVAPTFIRCPAAEAYLTGKKISDDVASHAGSIAVDTCRPITDVRGSADYRRRLVQVLVKRSLLEAASNVTG